VSKDSVDDRSLCAMGPGLFDQEMKNYQCDASSENSCSWIRIRHIVTDNDTWKHPLIKIFHLKTSSSMQQKTGRRGRH